MVLRVDGVVGGRTGIPFGPGARLDVVGPRILGARGPWRRVHRAMSRLFFWGLRGYQEANAGDLAAAVAFNGLVALVPTFLLCLAVAGLFLRIDNVLITAIYTSFWGLPAGAASDALEGVLTARRNSGWIGALSLTIFAWTGAGFVGCLARSMNRIYGVPGCGYLCEKRRGFFIILAFAALFVLSILASTLPTLFVNAELPPYIATLALADGTVQAISYGLALFTAILLFGTLYRVVPNAGQRLMDLWPGALTAAALFVIMAQVFPVYIRMIGGANRYGVVFGLISLLVAWFYALAHVLLFGAYVNVTHQRRRRQAAVQHQKAVSTCVGG